MLTAEIKSNSQKVVATSANKNDKPFICPECKKDVTLKKGKIVAHHFAHKPPVNCEYGKGETEEHRNAKLTLYEELKKNTSFTVCELEHSLGTVRPNIYLEDNGYKIAIELQVSNLTANQLVEKTKIYFSKKIHVLWLAIYNKNILSSPYTPKSWEKWLHTLNYGKVYYWKEKTKIIPIHFDDFMLDRPQKEWYEKGGEHRVEGGYEYRSKRYRTPNVGDELELTSDFKKTINNGFKKSKIEVPECLILTDTKQKWWK
ncbi:MAG: competence protein CoiA [Ignavibacteriae bacterium]|nr:competence protein CoiA [Ignavibacteriota bacterium]